MGRLLLLFALSALIVAADDCVNDDSATDSKGDTCSGFYDSNFGDCGNYDTEDFTASERCCACNECCQATYITLSVLLPVLFVLLAGAAYVRCKKMEDETYAAAARRVLCRRGTKVRAVAPATSEEAPAPPASVVSVVDAPAAGIAPNELGTVVSVEQPPANQR